MPSNVRRRSLSSVVIKSADPGRINKAVMGYINKIRVEHPEIVKIIWFGSWINGLPTPGSDVDLCLILSSSDKPIRERITKYLPVGFPVGIELFPYTIDEFRELSQGSPSWYNAIISGREFE